MTILTNILLLTALNGLSAYCRLRIYRANEWYSERLSFQAKDTAPDDDYEVLIGGEGELAILFEEKLKENGVSCLRIPEFDSKAREEMMAVSSRWHEVAGAPGMAVFALDGSDYHTFCCAVWQTVWQERSSCTESVMNRETGGFSWKTGYGFWKRPVQPRRDCIIFLWGSARETDRQRIVRK